MLLASFRRIACGACTVRGVCRVGKNEGTTGGTNSDTYAAA
ncbi:hypothetical protein [Oxalobacter formigenes]|nr:hypothetical protein [Oxalobacter formigenes]